MRRRKIQIFLNNFVPIYNEFLWCQRFRNLPNRISSSVIEANWKEPSTSTSSAVISELRRSTAPCWRVPSKLRIDGRRFLAVYSCSVCENTHTDRSSNLKLRRRHFLSSCSRRHCSVMTANLLQYMIPPLKLLIFTRSRTVLIDINE